MTEPPWRVRLGAAAEVDLVNIVRWTLENFGLSQAETYRDTLLGAIAELSSGPAPAGSKARDEILPGLRTLHVARHGRRGRHFLLYRVAKSGHIEIVRILHDRMDLSHHLPPTNDEGDSQQ